MKLGRNDFCHCGSGKKYKKCCLDLDNKASSHPKSHSHSGHTCSCGADHSAYKSGISQKKVINTPEGIHPYIMAKMTDPTTEHVQQIAAMNPVIKKNISNYIGIFKIKTFSKDQIIQGLIERGVDYSQDQFLEAANNSFSAWSIAKKIWIKQLESWDMNVSDFVGMAACVLWERYFSEGLINKYSLEMLDDLMQEGYLANEGHDSELTIKLWTNFWSILKQELNFKGMTLSKLELLLNGTQSVSNWANDMEMATLNYFTNLKFKRLDLAGNQETQGLRSLSIECLEDLVSLSSNEEPHLTKNLLMTLGECYCIFGDQAKGEKIMEDLRKNYPHEVRGYIGLSEALGYRVVDDESEKKALFEQRIKILQEALAYPVVDGPDYDLEVRLESLLANQ